MGVEAGGNQDEFGVESGEGGKDLRLISGANEGTVRPGRQGQVDDLTMRAAFGRLARAGPQRHLLRGGEKGAGFVPQQGLGAIAMMHVEIDDGHARKPVMIECAFGGDRDGAEQAKAHRGFGQGMVAGRAGHDKGVAGLTRQHGIDSSTGPADRPEGRLQTAGRHPGVGVKRNDFGHRSAGMDEIDIAHGMAAQDVFRHGKRLAAAFGVQPAQTTPDGDQTFDTLRVTGGGQVAG